MLVLDYTFITHFVYCLLHFVLVTQYFHLHMVGQHAGFEKGRRVQIKLGSALPADVMTSLKYWAIICVTY